MVRRRLDRFPCLCAAAVFLLAAFAAAPLPAQDNPFLSTEEAQNPAESGQQKTAPGEAPQSGAAGDESAGGKSGGHDPAGAGTAAGTRNETRGAGAAAGSASKGGSGGGARGGSGGSRLGGLLRSAVPRWLTDLQRSLYSRISGSFQTVREAGAASTAFAVLLSLAFLYGLLHALGPGHRKTVLFSYFLARGAPVRTGVTAGLSMALLHGASAAAVVLTIYYLLRGALLVGVQRTESVMETATFGLIALFGTVMLVKTLIQLLSSGQAGGPENRAGTDKNQSRDHPALADEPRSPAPPPPAAEAASGGAAGPEAGPVRKRDRGTLVLILVSGMLPCPGAAMILLFAMSMKMLGLGLLVVAAMSLGMGVTLAGVAVVTLGGRRLIIPAGGEDGRRYAWLHHAAEIGGYSLVMVIGLLMFLASV
jgi:ABC-type nickel/cobalt efflux system permease component RcnA